MFRLPDSWVWDFWVVDDGQRYHLFFLFASRALHDPEARHYRASIGHAVSDDLVHWERVADALVRSNWPAWDDVATWTGSIVQGDDGTWHLFYTGATLNEKGQNTQRIGVATSPDLYTWTKQPGPILQADSRWYELLADGVWHDEAFRDPWVLRDPAGNGWHMLITARANHGEPLDRGVVGWAWSADLRKWELRPPLTGPRHGFGQLEVVQYVESGSDKLLVFNCTDTDMAPRRVAESTGGVWVARAEGPLGPFDIENAELVLDARHYVGKLVQLRGTDDYVLLAFKNRDESGKGFIGEIIDPLPVRIADGRLHLLDQLGAPA